MSRPRVSVQVDGFGDLEKKLRRLPDAVRGRKLDSAARAGAEVLVEFMQAMAPRGDDGPPHAFQFIAANRMDTRSPEVVDYAVGPGGAGFYLTFHETGTLYLAPQPFMRPAKDAAEPHVIEAVADDLRRGLSLIARSRV